MTKLTHKEFVAIIQEELAAEQAAKGAGVNTAIPPQISESEDGVVKLTMEHLKQLVREQIRDLEVAPGDRHSDTGEEGVRVYQIFDSDGSSTIGFVATEGTAGDAAVEYLMQHEGQDAKQASRNQHHTGATPLSNVEVQKAMMKIEAQLDKLTNLRDMLLLASKAQKVSAR